MELAEIQDMAKTMRHKILEISHTCNLSAHLGGGLSMVDIMAVLYGRVLRYEQKNRAGRAVIGLFSAKDMAFWAISLPCWWPA